MEKNLIFSKTSIQSFVYESINFFIFPNDVVNETYEKKNEIQKGFLF